MDIKELDAVLLKDGREGTVLEIYEHGNVFMVEICDGEGCIHYKQMRIFHMWEGSGKITYGIYACSPTDGSYQATFSSMQITDCQWKSDSDWKM